MENKVKVMRCKICGEVAAPWFGFWKGCRYGVYGRHEEKEIIYISEKEASFLLKEVLRNAQSFDVINFEIKAGEEYKRLLKL